MPFKTLSHTSELKIEVISTSKKGLFKESINALASILGKKETKTFYKKSFKIKNINVGPKDKCQTIMLINLLNNILTTSHIKKKIYIFSSFKKFSSEEIIVECKGYKVKSFKEDIKALTFYKSKIENKGGLWKIKLTFDI